MAKVIVVDDDPAARCIMARLLTPVGHEAHACADAAEAIHEALLFKPDVLVADWVLRPFHTGLDIAECMRAVDPALGVVFVSGLQADQVEPRAQSLGEYRFLSKPCEFYALFEAVEGVMHRN